MKLPAVDRRTLLIGGGTGIGLIVAFLAWPRREGSPLRPGPRDAVFGPFLRIGIDSRVTLAVTQAETGQDGREHSRRLFVFANQKRLKCHMRALCPNSTLAGLRPARSAWRRLRSGCCSARRR